jgi:hypothetical protein
MKNLRWDSRKVIPNELEGNKIYLESLVLVHYLRIEAWKVDELGFGSGRRLQQLEGGKNECWANLAWGRWVFMVNSRIKSLYPVIIGAYVNTKNWYREETDMWDEFGRSVPFGRRFSSKHSVETSAVGNTPSFGRRTVPRENVESIRECEMTWIGYKEEDELMVDTRRTWRHGVNFRQ